MSWAAGDTDLEWDPADPWSRGRLREAYFWATQSGAELDLLVFVQGRRFGFEFKYADAPAVTKSMRIARADLGLERLFVVAPGDSSYPLEDWAEVVSIKDLRSRLGGLAGG